VLVQDKADNSRLALSTIAQRRTSQPASSQLAQQVLASNTLTGNASGRTLVILMRLQADAQAHWALIWGAATCKTGAHACMYMHGWRPLCWITMREGVTVICGLVASQTLLVSNVCTKNASCAVSVSQADAAATEAVRAVLVLLR
jgi:hypothetical protein